jgi:selenocysteine-specific elongation factor
LEDVLIAAAHWSSLKESAAMVLTAYHKSYPLRRGIPREELKSRLQLTPRLFNLVINRLALEDALIAGEKWAALPGHVVQFSPFQQVKVDRLLEQFAQNPYTPPSIKDCQSQVGEDVFSTLLEFGDLMAVSDEVVFRKSDYVTMVKKIRTVIQQKGQINLGEARDLFNTSRRYVQALLEHLDHAGVTVRSGDFRKLKNISV